MILHTGIYDYSFDVSVALPKGANQHEPMAHISKVKLLLKLLLYKKMLLYNSLPPEPTDLHFFFKVWEQKYQEGANKTIISMLGSIRFDL